MIASPETLEISPPFFSWLNEYPDDSALRIGKTNLLAGSIIYPTPLKAIGDYPLVNKPFDVVVKGSKKLLEYTTLRFPLAAELSFA